MGDRRANSITQSQGPARNVGELPPRTKSIPVVAKLPRPRWVLHLQAQVWRFLMGIGMFLHRLAPPHPPRPAFMKSIPAKLSGKPGWINLYFYTPGGYESQKRLWKRQAADSEDEDVKGPVRRRSLISQVGDTIKRRSSTSRRWGSYPVVVNFHGGGFTLGTPSDDARWCGTVVDECHAVVVAVDYRLAPEHPFPTAVEDGADAVIWVHQHAEELGIDANKIAISGFSSGGNMAFTVPLRIHDEVTGFARDGHNTAQRSGSEAGLPVDPEQDSSTATPSTQAKGGAVVTAQAVAASKISIRAIVPWYPSLDYTRTRTQRRATSVRKDQDLPAMFTDLFDESYLHPPNDISMDSPYLSPGVAPTSLLKDGLPQDIIMHTCEWDMLLDEGQVFHARLASPPLNKNVYYKMIEGVPHGWDKAPNPWKPTPGVREHYLRACKELRRVFNPPNVPERALEDEPTSNSRRSIQFVR